jgi:putative MATE family efflux protein
MFLFELYRSIIVRMDKNESTKRFEWGAFLRSIAVIAIPVAMQNLLTTTGSMVDTIMLASLGENAIGAVGLCAQLSSLMFSCYWGFVGGGMLFFSQYWGAGDEDGITRSYGVTLAFLMGVAAFFTFFTLREPGLVMSIYTDKPAIQRIGAEYLSTVGFGYPLQILAVAMSALLRSTERVKIPLCAAICSVCSNCFFNYLFIFGGFGFPRLGVRGAAIGTVIASFVNVAVIASAVIKYKIPFVLEIRRHFKWTREFLGIYLRKCLPVICNEFFIGVGNMMINIVLGRQSEQAIAAVAVFRTLEGIIISFFTGFSNAASVLIGKEVGAGNHEVAYQRGIRLVYLCSALIGCACLMLIALHVPMLHAMGLHGESFGICTGMLLIFSVVALLRMGNWAQNDTFRAAGDPLFGSVMEITFMFLMVQPLIYSANFYFKAPFLLVFALCYADEPIRYVIMQRHLYSGKWIRPVSDAGEATIADFRHRHGIKLRGRDS